MTTHDHPQPPATTCNHSPTHDHYNHPHPPAPTLHPPVPTCTHPPSPGTIS
ncbi:hypothetical protein APHAL10511_008385, partial [Amanita phalloides]